MFTSTASEAREGPRGGRGERRFVKGAGYYESVKRDRMVRGRGGMALRIGWGTGDLVASRGGGAVLAARTTRLAGWSGDCGARGPHSGSVHPHSSRVCQGEAGSRSLLFPALLHALRPDQAQPVKVSFDSCHEEKAGPTPRLLLSTRWPLGRGKAKAAPPAGFTSGLEEQAQQATASSPLV